MKIPTPDDIKEAAKAKGLSISGLCRRADVDTTAFYRWQKGENSPNVATVQKMLDAIEATPDREEAEA